MNKIEPKEIVEARVMLDEFHELWKDSGSPHPNSNEYLQLNRSFFYQKGFEKAIAITTEVTVSVNDES